MVLAIHKSIVQPVIDKASPLMQLAAVAAANCSLCLCNLVLMVRKNQVSADITRFSVSFFTLRQGRGTASRAQYIAEILHLQACIRLSCGHAQIK